MIRLICFLLFFVSLYGQDVSDNISDNIQPLLVEELSDLELMLIANINTNETLETFFKLDVINESIKLNAPQYNRFARKNNIGMFFGGRDHTTVLHALKTIGKKQSSNDRMKRMIISIKKDLGFSFL